MIEHFDPSCAQSRIAAANAGDGFIAPRFTGSERDMIICTEQRFQARGVLAERRVRQLRREKFSHREFQAASYSFRRQCLLWQRFHRRHDCIERIPADATPICGDPPIQKCYGLFGRERQLCRRSVLIRSRKTSIMPAAAKAAFEYLPSGFSRAWISVRRSRSVIRVCSAITRSHALRSAEAQHFLTRFRANPAGLWHQDHRCKSRRRCWIERRCDGDRGDR